MPSELVVVGRVSGAYGVHGMVRITSLTDPADNIRRYRPWLLEHGDGFRDVAVSAVKAHGGGYLARLDDVTDRDDAQALAGRLIAVPRSVLPDLEPGEEFYWRDLVGLAAVAADGTTLGTVDHLLETGAHDVLVITDGKRQTLIPFIAPFVAGVDLAAGRIDVEWSEPV